MFHVRGPAAAKERSPKCCSDVVHGRRIAPRTAGVSIQKVQPADNCQPGDPAPLPHRQWSV